MIDNRNTIVLIPARMASTRLPGKPLADINGLPMIVQCWKRATEANIGQVLVAAAGVWPVVLLGRMVDRFGKGVRSAPRDALIAADDHATQPDFAEPAWVSEVLLGDRKSVV